MKATKSDLNMHTQPNMGRRGSTALPDAMTWDLNMLIQLRVSRNRGRLVNGFTLAELLTVLAVIAMLAVPLLAMTAKDRLAVRQIQCAGNLRQLTRCALLYCGDSDSSLYYSGPGGLWMGDLRVYTSQLNQEIVCPSALPRAPHPVNDAAGAADIGWTWASGTNLISGSYGLNGWMYYNDSYGRGNSFLFNNLSAIAFPSQTPVFVDCVFCDLWPLETDAPSINLYTGAGATALPFGGMRNPPDVERCVIARHGGLDPALAPTNFVGGVLPGAINMGFADGHVETVRLEKLWCYYWHLNWNPALVSFPHPPPTP